MNQRKKLLDNALNKRFYSYKDIRDKIFLILAKPISYFLFKFGFTANFVTLISGLFSIIGGLLISSDNKFSMFIGSLFFVAFYLFDYVDGIVARLRNEQSIGGQYIDLIMHLVTAVSFSLGVSIGAINNNGSLMIPLAFVNVIACTLAFSRFSVGWMAISMKFLENKRNISSKISDPRKLIKKRSNLNKIFNRLGSLIFHEDYFIFTLPLILLFNLQFGEQLPIDIRSLLLIYGCIFYFPVTIVDILFFSNNRIDLYYSKTFESNASPDLPNHIYFD